ncbi:hypothetical protein [Halocatena marina]|uniref:DUF11 domain-containing protein n=1 Tax=Halocatena marina TaxID=2934937 RepID=A0ABD5YRD7_9EURY|nr:hypothetical protein [Halocatena marina]
MWSNLRSADSRVSRRTFLSALGAGLISSTAGCVHPLPPPQGVLIQKGIFGERNNRRVPVLKIKTNETTIEDGVVKDVLPRSEEPANTTISGPLNDQLEQRYDDVYYYIQVRKLNPHGPLVETKNGKRPRQPAIGGTPRYLLSRESFGKLIAGDRIEYTLDLFNSGTIAALTLIIREGTIKEKRRASDTSGKKPAYRITVSHGERPNGDPSTMTYYATSDVYESIQTGTRTYFDIIFENRVRPTIRSFSPDPYGNL